MQFNESTNDQGLYQDASYIIFGDSDDHASDYPLKDFTRHANKWMDKVVSAILEVDNRFTWDDNNQSDLPISQVALVSGQKDYGIANSTYLKISRIDCGDENGNDIKLLPFQEQEVNQALSEFKGENGTPRYYRLQANSLFLYPTPSYSTSAANGLRIFYQRTASYFTASDTSKEPGFAEPYHDIISLGAAYEYFFANDMHDKADRILNRLIVQNAAGDIIGGKFRDMQNYYLERNDTPIRLKTRKEDYGQSALGSGLSNHPDRF